MKIAVIGCSGGMGTLFVRYFLSRNFDVAGSDHRKTTVKSPRFEYFRSNSEAVRGAEYVLLATPIDDTLQTAREVLRATDRRCTLIEISSVKGRVLPSLRRLISSSGRRLLSIHPLFGPSTESLHGMKIAIIVKNRASEMRVARRLLRGAKLFAIGEGEHDRLMALALSLHHFLNLAYAKTLTRYISPSDFRKLSTPNSLLQLTLAEGVLAQNPSLYSYIQIGNEHSRDVLKSLVKEMGAIHEIIESRDRKRFEVFFRKTSRFYHKDSKSHKVLEKISRASRIVNSE